METGPKVADAMNELESSHRFLADRLSHGDSTLSPEECLDRVWLTIDVEADRGAGRIGRASLPASRGAEAARREPRPPSGSEAPRLHIKRRPHPLDLWRAQNPPEQESETEVQAIREAIDDVRAGDAGRPLHEFLSEFRSERGIAG